MSREEKPLNERLGRKHLIKILAALPAVAVAGLAAPRIAEAKGSKASFKYQDKPKNGQECDACRFYLPNKKNMKAKGGCTLVDGDISPKGWCIAFAKK